MKVYRHSLRLPGAQLHSGQRAAPQVLFFLYYHQRILSTRAKFSFEGSALLC